ncbi:helix-turn-helix domain-containing protein [Acidovorax sp. Root568]|uniref:helix-turn-helix domain-containing protein n=1 Tax=Acidovorax sp. Root568 TaxID=1736565 RepID=UPI0009EAF76F|nr:helix-turn-helix transcriptional regulator [Acidovorax sp. Root568]
MSRTAPQKKDAANESPVQRRRKVRHIPNTITQAIGKNLRHFREQRGMTQLELAMTAEVERTRISKLELGLVNPSVLTVATICHVLGITLADLFADIRLAHPPTTEGGPLRRANQAVLDKKPQARQSAKGRPKAGTT